MSTVEVLGDEAQLGGVIERWDALAVAARRPYCTPGWMLAWWRHVAPAGARLRVVTVNDGPELVAIAPLCVARERIGLTTCRLLASQVSSRCEPLAAPGHERAASRAIAAALADSSPAPDLVMLGAAAPDSPYPDALSESWPAGQRPSVHPDRLIESPHVTLAGTTFDEWYASKSRNFREQIRRRRRQLERAGAAFVLAATRQDAERGLRAFIELHHARWSRRGGSGVLTPQVEAMLLDAGPELVAAGRLRLWTIEVDGRAISAHVFLGVADEFTYWLGGFDESWAAQQPALQTLVAAVEHAFAAGDTRLDLGAGAQPYKNRLADGRSLVRWTAVLPPGPRRARARALLAARRWRTHIRRLRARFR
jgi:CelD/BcsL family acetyltransferase involved in cellulose biosynthesis